MWKLKWLALTMLILIAGCRSSIVVVDAGCLWVKPIYTSADDRKLIPRPVKEQLAVHNDMYVSRCQK